MRRVVSLAAFLLCLALLPVSAQRGGMRGGVHPGSFAGHGVAVHPGGPAFSGMHAGFGARTFSHRIGFGDRDFDHDFFHGGFHHRHCFGCRGFGFPWFAGYGYPGYYDPFWDSSYSDDYRFDEQQARETELANEMNYLNLREQRLREREDAMDRELEQQAYSRHQEARGSKPEQQASSQPSPATVLVFRDQHQQEVQNYAIVDGTLWILTPQSARKVPMSQLDLDATRKVNDDRGVEFQLPR